MRNSKDAYAILLAAHHPTANLIGVSTVHGNASLANTTYNTCAVLEALGRADVPVIRGAAKPLEREPVHAPFIHGESGLDGVNLPRPTKYKLDELPTGTAEMYKSLKKRETGSVWMIATGPLTNVADLLNRFPEVASVFHGVSIMGGAVGDGFISAPMHRKDGPGNMSRWAEFNIYCDPEAAAMVLQDPPSSRRTNLATLDLTHLCRADSSVIAQLFPPWKILSPPRKMMQEVMEYFRKTYQKQAHGTTDGPPLHDAVAAFAVLDMDDIALAETDDIFDIEVVTEEGEQYARTVLKPPKKNSEGIVVPRGIDQPRMWRDIELCLDRIDDLVKST